MARKAQPPQERLVHHTAASRRDLIAVYVYNESSYGEQHAERYLAFLEEKMRFIANHPTLGLQVEGFPDLRVYLAKTSGRRSAHGHRIFYLQVPEGIEVFRVLHTAMSWPQPLDQ